MHSISTSASTGAPAEARPAVSSAGGRSYARPSAVAARLPGCKSARAVFGNASNRSRSVSKRTPVSTQAAVADPTEATSEGVSESTITVGGKPVKVTVRSNRVCQEVTLETTMTTKLLLHWGVEGGKDYKGGWRLPGPECRPEGTMQYKDRALQTPFKPTGNDGQAVTIKLNGDEASDILNFVFKEEDTGVWYDSNGDNFALALNPMDVIMKATMTGEPAPMTLPDIPNELSGVWAYIKWEQAGCPNRNQQESDYEYRQGIEEMKDLLREGFTLDQLRQVARGEIKYTDFMKSVSSGGSYDFDAVSVDVVEKAPQLPEKLVNSQAYMLWIENGRPQGADFGQQAREKLEKLVLEGRSIQELEEEVFGARERQEEEDRKESQKAEAEAEKERAKTEAQAQKEKEKAEAEAKEIARIQAEEEAKRPKLPEKLVNSQAYMLWIENGRPQGADFGQQAREKLEKLVLEGRSIQELEEEVFGARERQEEEDRKESQKAEAEAEKERVKAEAQDQKEKEKAEAEAKEIARIQAEEEAKRPKLPEKLVNSQAYMLWIENGRPQGADFGQQAREKLEKLVLEEGRSIQELEEEVFGARERQEEKDRKEKAEAEAKALEERQEAEAQGRKEMMELQQRKSMEEMSQGSIEMGQAFMHQKSRDPMQFIKNTEVPLLAEDKNKKDESALEPLVQDAALDDTVKFRRVFPFGNKAGLLAVVRQDGDGSVKVDLTSDVADSVVLHWGVSPVEKRNDWMQPEEALLPEGSTLIKNGIAAETPFKHCDEDECDVELGGSKVPLQRATIELPPSHGLARLQFVIRSEDSTRWWKDGNSNFVVRVPGSGEETMESMEEDFSDNEVAAEIVRGETSNAWTLMHRYNMVSGILDKLKNGSYGDKVEVADAVAHLYVVLRFSANRHITWQRNYNTQPRILSAAQDRLTKTIADIHGQMAGESEEWVRLMMGMLGRGGDGQKIRDEILNIMHRNNIKEVKGTWMEEWHQKLHNNTTPDDIGICEAYLAFLRGNGDNGAYWRVLSDHGITRSRLESFDRAIRTEPEDYPHIRGNLIGEFENYLGILKAVHSGTDLQTSAQAASHSTPEAAKGYLGYVLSNMQGQVVPLLEAAVEARTEILKAARGNRELLYLDLALEGLIRRGAERAAGASPRSAIRIVGPLIQNLCLTAGDNEEICYCLAAWNALPRHVREGHRPNREEALQAAAVVDRCRIALANISDSISARIEPISSSLGHAFGVENWVIELFAEEVVRGGPAFAVSQVLGNIESGLRSAAELGAWQVISPGGAAGRVRIEHDLYKIQDDVYDEPTILVIDRVTGEEEIPEGTVAVLTPDAPDVLSHVSVRARNMHVLFATCHDAGPLDELKGLEGKVIDVKTSAAGSVMWEETDGSALEPEDLNGNGAKKGNLKIHVPEWVGKYAVGMDEFKDNVVGAKSKNISGLRGKLPDWVNLPASVTIPFSSFEKALEEPECKEVKKRLEEEVKRISEHPAEALRNCREIIMDMTVPEALKADLGKEMKAAGMEWPNGVERWDEAFTALKGVWASKFNERAYISMRKAGLPFMDLRMAVLVMRVIPAEYAFVIHTVNPATRDESEIYCELVKGLGETLVSGQFPGKSMAFSAKKDDLENPQVLSYPSKNAAMFVADSLIFRSDSNGEDLDGYAGAGLYDSITMDPCMTKRVDYTSDRMINDEEFRRHTLSQICQVGLAIEEALGSAQDVEGVVDSDGKIYVVQTRPQV